LFFILMVMMQLLVGAGAVGAQLFWLTQLWQTGNSSFACEL